jgi:hypothetical protein
VKHHDLIVIGTGSDWDIALVDQRGKNALLEVSAAA